MTSYPVRVCHNRFGAVGTKYPAAKRTLKGKLGLMTTTHSVATLEAVTQEIIDLARAEVGAVDLTADSTLQGVGLDSLKVMSLVFKIEAHYDILLDEEDADDLRTVGDLAALVVRRLEDQS